MPGNGLWVNHNNFIVAVILDAYAISTGQRYLMNENEAIGSGRVKPQVKLYTFNNMYESRNLAKSAFLSAEEKVQLATSAT